MRRHYRVKARLQSATPILFGAPFKREKKDKESHNDYEDRVWEDRLHTHPDGKIYIPGAALQKCMQAAGQHMAEHLEYPGKGTWTKHFLRGLSVSGDIDLDTDKYGRLDLYVPAQPGNKRSGTRVWKHFPVVKKWDADVEFLVMDPVITESVFKEVLYGAGAFIGLGAMRAENGNSNGRFICTKLEWIEVAGR